MTARLEQLRARIEDPFLVTNLTNVFYLTGFESSNGSSHNLRRLCRCSS